MGQNMIKYKQIIKVKQLMLFKKRGKNMDFKNYANNHKDQLIKDLNGLLKIETVLIEQPNIKQAPFGEKMVEALEYMLDLGKSMGFVTKNIDNVAGHIEYGEGDEVIGVLVHLDVVPAGDGWTYPPFEPTLVGDKLFARGSLDDKGAVMASLYALKALKDLNIKLNKKVRLILGTDEETSSRCIKRYLEVEKMPDLGFSPDADFPLIYAEKGIMSFDLECDYNSSDIIKLTSGDRYNVVPEKAFVSLSNNVASFYHAFLLNNKYKGEAKNNELIMYGKRAHGMQPEKGKNAALQLISFLNQHIKHPMIKFVNKYMQDNRLKDMNEQFSDKEMKDLTMNVAMFDINNKYAKVGVNLRYPINWHKEQFLDNLEKLLAIYNINIKVISDSEPHYVSPDDELVKILHQSYIKYTKDNKTPIMTIGGGTYARALKRAVAFGPMMPGREDVVHQVDEYVHISDLLSCVMIFADALYNLGK